MIDGKVFVLYVMRSEDAPNGKSEGEVRPAVITAVWGETCANLLIFQDAEIDGHRDSDTSLTQHRSSVLFSEGKEPGTWHWPEAPAPAGNSAAVQAETPAG